MATKTHIVGYRRKHARHSLPSQTVALEAAGVIKIHDDLDLCIRQRRRRHGDVVAVTRLMLLADPSRRYQAGGMRQALYKAIDAIEAAGATILELETGRSTSDPRQRDQMIRDAIDDLARTRKGTRRPGRPRRVWTDEQRTIMEIHWRDLRHRTNRDAVAQINANGVRCSVSQVIKLLGASGRALGPK